MRQRTEADLARYRLEKAANELKVARANFSLGHYDVAVGRCYYSIFSAMRALLAMKKLDSKSHKGVISLFGQHFIRENLFPRGFHRIITEAKDIREKADYGDFMKVPSSIASKHIANAELFLQKVGEVLERSLAEQEESKKKNKSVNH